MILTERTLKDVQAELAEVEVAEARTGKVPIHCVSATTFMVNGLKLEESQ